MATVKFTENSPYTEPKRREHHSDFKYTKYVDDSGLHKNPETENQTPKEFRPQNVALFGLGRAGSIHAVNILANPKFRLLYIVEEDPARLKRIKLQFGLENTTLLSSDKEDLIFSDPKVHGVIITTPTITHETIATKALKAGKAVFCEKPISQDEEGIKRCYAIAKEVGKPLFCAFNRRYEPTYMEAYRKVRNGCVGRVHIIKSVARDSPLPSLDYIKLSGGIFHDCAVHDIDLLCWIAGEFPEKVFAVGTCFIPEIEAMKDYDTVAITLSFASGTIGTIDISRNAVYGYDQRLEIFGPKGMIACGNEMPMQVSFSGLGEQSHVPIYHSFPSRYQEGYKLELNRFCEVMQGKSTDYISGENTLKISKIASALEESANSGKFITVQY